MSDAFLSELGWLPRAPADFKGRCEALARSSAPGNELRALATHALDGLQLERLARAIKGLRGCQRCSTRSRVGVHTQRLRSDRSKGLLQFTLAAEPMSGAS
jgi:hypothetical protein